jgi:hypothetical protein
MPEGLPAMKVGSFELCSYKLFYGLGRRNQMKKSSFAFDGSSDELIF